VVERTPSLMDRGQDALLILASYSSRRARSDSTSYASETSRKRRTAAGSPGLWSAIGARQPAVNQVRGAA
jgi:hypothetical protein